MTTKERIRHFLKEKNISERRFYKETSFSNGFLTSGKHIGTDKAEIIIEKYTDLSLYWLITGKGEMLKTEQNEPSSSVQNSKIVELEKKVFELEIRLDECRIKNQGDNSKQKAV